MVVALNKHKIHCHYYGITGYQPKTPKRFLDHFIKQLKSKPHYQMIQLRSKHFSKATLFDLLLKISALPIINKHQLIINSDQYLKEMLPHISGIHLTSNTLQSYQRKMFPSDKIIGASCHNLNDIKRAEEKGLDFITLSPVLPTTSHPTVTHLGWEAFKKLAKATYLPIYALGGITQSDLSNVQKNHGFGIASISDFWH